MEKLKEAELREIEAKVKLAEVSAKAQHFDVQLTDFKEEEELKMVKMQSLTDMLIYKDKEIQELTLEI